MRGVSMRLLPAHSRRRRVAALALPALLLMAPWPAHARQARAAAGPVVCAIDPADGEQAIAAAIAACPDGTTVRFPPRRTYRQTGSIVVHGRTGLTIDGNRSTFVRAVPDVAGQREPNWVLEEGRRVALQRMTVVGAFKDPGPRRIIPGNQHNHGVAVRGGTGIRVRDLRIRDVFGDLVTVEPPGHDALAPPPRDVRIQRLDGRRAARQCVAVTGAIGFWLQDSRLANCFQLGVDIEQDVPGEPLRDIHVVRTSIGGFHLSAIGVAGSAVGAPRRGDIDRVDIRANTVRTPSDTCWPAVTTERGPVSRVVTAGNTLRTLGDGVRYAAGTSGAITGNRVINRAGPVLCGSLTALTRPVRAAATGAVTLVGNVGLGYRRR